MSDMTEPEERKRIASCGCGGLTATARGEPVDVYLCSCLACQKASGSAFTYCALFAEASVSIAGAHQAWRYQGDVGRWIETAFCPTCGGTVYFRGEGLPGLLGIGVGCFAEPDFAKPGRLYWASRRHHWLDLPEDVELLPTQPD
ncbi:MAG: GFA family protein [Dongiaceae bacterium]